MKIRVDSKQAGYAYKKHIVKLAREKEFLSLYEVYDLFPTSDWLCKDSDLDPKTIGWRSTDLRTDTVRVRSTNNMLDWWLYFPEPDLPISSLTIDKETAARMAIKPTELIFPVKMDDKEKIDYFIDSFSKIFGGKRKAMVHHKLNKKTIIDRPCWFHTWTQNIVVRDGEIICQDLGICEFPEDGHVERIAWDHIRFVEEWE